MSDTESGITRRTALAAVGTGLFAPGSGSPEQAAESSGAAPAAAAPARGVTPRGLLFANPTFHFETLRNAGYIVSNCADLSEILETVKVISEGDAQSWYAAWEATADRVLALAERTQDSLSKGGAYMRACTYQRMAEFLIPPDDPRRRGSLEKIGGCFFKGLDTLGVRYERISVPYGEGSLRALYFPGPQGAETKPLIMFGGGFDSILEEYYPNFAEAALKRGYSVLIYEGPGQGEALRKYGLTYTAEWERPVTATLDAFLDIHAKPLRIVLVGMSLGGYFAPRAAAFEKRIDGIVAYDTMYDFGAVLGPVLAAAKNPAAMNNISVSWAYRNAMWTMGTSNADEAIQASAAYTLAPVAERIRQDVLLLAGAEDHFVPTHQTADFEKALVNARSVTTRIFDRQSGGAGHCQPGALTLYHAAVFDWLLEKLPAAPKS
jgi:alpha-beta hydrolase superfamily lysophospholipase